VQRLTASFADRIVTGQPVRRIRRSDDGCISISMMASSISTMW
jgi:predicted NAD/FAD-binding protein